MLERIGDGNDPGLNRDFRAAQSFRASAAIKVLVVGSNDWGEIMERLDPSEASVAECCMPRVSLGESGIGATRHEPNIMEEGAEPDGLDDLVTPLRAGARCGPKAN